MLIKSLQPDTNSCSAINTAYEAPTARGIIPTVNSPTFIQI